MTRVGKYELHEKLGEGSMGIIYRAQDTVLEREVALKTLSTAGVNDPELLERFYREARACARLRHPNIVAVYDFGQDENLAFIAMELLEGADLRHVIAQRQTMTLEQKLELMAGVCDGLHHAHGKAIVHRDIKPSNIFVVNDGAPRILDFGVARMPASSLTVSGRVLGTPHYMAPEQLTGKPCDSRSDIFSAAIVTFELIAGTHPFHGSSHGSRMRRIVEGSPESLLAVNPDLPEALEQVLARALAKRPEDRFPSAAAFAEALRSQMSAVRDLTDPWPSASGVVTSAHSTETIMSELLDCLQKFDDAADRGDAASARAAYEVMCKVSGGDTRYAVALDESAKRLVALGVAAPAAPERAPVPEPPPTIPESGPAMVLVPEPSMAGEATMLFDSVSLDPVRPLDAVAAPPIPKPVAKPSPQPAPQAADPSPVILTARVSPSPAAPLKANRLKLWAGAGVAAALVAMAGAILLPRVTGAARPAVVPAVAIAQVVSDKSSLRGQPADTAPSVGEVRRGNKLRILRLPVFREQLWTEVQYVSGDTVSPRAFARTADLGEWSSSNPQLDAQLHQIFAEEPTLTPAPEPAKPQTPSPIVAETKLNAAAELAAAATLWQSAEYEKSLWVLDRLLKAQPNSPEAIKLRDKVKRAKELEGR